jgi:hypothetical protein
MATYKYPVFYRYYENIFAQINSRELFTSFAFLISGQGMGLPWLSCIAVSRNACTVIWWSLYKLIACSKNERSIKYAHLQEGMLLGCVNALI